MFSRKMNWRFLLVDGYLIELPQMTTEKFEKGHEKAIFGQKCSKVQKCSNFRAHFFSRISRLCNFVENFVKISLVE